MTKDKIFKALALFLALVLMVPMHTGAKTVQAAAKPELNKTSIELTLGQGAKKLKVGNLPDGSKVSWSVKNKKIVALSVTKKGVAVLTPVKAGKTTVTCEVTASQKTYILNCSVKVNKAEVPAKSVKITNAVINDTYNAHCLTEGESYTFTAKTVSSVKGEACTDKIYWASSNTNIAKVSKGKVTAVGAGTAKITAYAGRTKNKALSSKVKKTIRVHVEAGAIKVDKVALEHSRLLKIYFNNAMKAESIYNETTKELLGSAVVIQPEREGGVDARLPGRLTASLSSNGKELSIESENGFSGTYSVSVSNKVTGKDGTPLKESYYEKLELKDTKAPAVKLVDTDESGTTCVITFDEPVDITNLVVKDPVKADGSPVYSGNWSSILTTASNYVLSKDKTQLSINLSGLVEKDLNCEIKVKMSGITDLVNNAATDGGTNAYITVGLITNTMDKSEARCLLVSRNGKSLVAVFDQPIYAPGMAAIGNSLLPGKVNQDNKKEVIYSLENSGLESSREILSVKLVGFSVFTNNTKATDYTANVNFASTKKATVAAESSFATKTINGIREKVLSVTFTSSVNVPVSSGSISATETVDGAVNPAKDYAYRISVDGKTVTFILTGNFLEQAQYSFRIPAGFFTDVYGNANDVMDITVTKTAGDASPLPAPSLIQLDGTDKNKVYVTFNSMIDKETAENAGNYSIQGAVVTSARVVINDNKFRSPAVVELSLKSPLADTDIAYQVQIKNIKGYQGEYTAMSDYNQMIKLGNNVVFTCTAAASESSGQLVLTFNSDVNASLSKINFAVSSNTTKTFTIKGTPVVSGKTITISFNETLVRGDSITLIPLIDNMVFNVNNQQMLNVPIPVTVM